MLKITEDGLNYVKTPEFTRRLSATVDFVRDDPERAGLSGSIFTALCLTGFGRCDCPTMCRDEFLKFHQEGGAQFLLDNSDKIEEVIVNAIYTNRRAVYDKVVKSFGPVA